MPSAYEMTLNNCYSIIISPFPCWMWAKRLSFFGWS